MREIITAFVVLVIVLMGLNISGVEVVFDSPISPLPTPTPFKTASYVPGGPPIDTPTNTPTITPVPTLTLTSTQVAKDSAGGGNQPVVSEHSVTSILQTATSVPAAVEPVVVKARPEFLGNCFFLRADLICYE